MTAGKIPVFVVSGFLGSGKTRFLNRYLAEQADGGASIIVLLDEAGMAELNHSRTRSLGVGMSMRDTGCACCSVQGPLVVTLRELFMGALRKSIPAFSSVIIETGGLMDPAPIRFSLQYERFLHERYRYAGCLTIVEATRASRQLRDFPEANQQVALADVLAVHGMQQSSPAELASLNQILQRLNPTASLHDMQSESPSEIFAQLGKPQQERRVKPVAEIGAALSWPKQPASGQYEAVIMEWAEPQPRAAAAKALEAAVSTPGIDVLRLKASFEFQGTPGRWAIQGVHQVIYPGEREPSHDCLNAHGRCVLWLVVRCHEMGARQKLVARIRDQLPGAMLSTGDNFAS